MIDSKTADIASELYVRRDRLLSSGASLNLPTPSRSRPM